MIAAESLARWTLMLMSIALAIGGFDVRANEPDDEPGVAAGVMGGLVDGWPSPGVRFVVQPNTASEQANTAAVKPPRKLCVFLCILPPVGCLLLGLQVHGYLEQLA